MTPEFLWRMEEVLDLYVDSEYRREGSCCLFLAVEPKRGWRHLEVRERRTSQDFAEWMKELVEEHFPEAETVEKAREKFRRFYPNDQ